MTDDTPQKARERSRRYPFIPLSKALDRAQELKDANGLHAARAQNVVAAWGYSEKSSGGRQTIAALIMYGILSDFGSGQDRKLQLTEIAQRFLIDKRPEVRADAIRKMALEPEVMNVLWNAWGSPPPSKNECLSQLVFDYGFTENAASEMLDIYKQNVDFAQLTKSSSEDSRSESTTEGNAGSSSFGAETSGQPAKKVSDPFEDILMGMFSKKPAPPIKKDSKPESDVKVIQDGKKLQVIAKDLDLEGVQKLRELLGKYEEILKIL